MSRFNYPNRLYARSQNNKTIDMSYAPQCMDAVEYIKADAIREWAEKMQKESVNTVEESVWQDVIDKLQEPI